jgi:hypothetical protein
LVGQALGKGHFDDAGRTALGQDPDLAALHGRADFHKLFEAPGGASPGGKRDR